MFISIDDHEQAQLKLLCDEIFGEENFIVNLIWRKKRGGGRGNSLVIPQTEYILVYARNLGKLNPFTNELSEYKIEKFKYKDAWGEYAREGLDHHSPKGAYERRTLQYNLEIDGKSIYCPTGQWLWSKERVNNELKNYKINKDGQKEYKYLDIVQDKNKRWRAFKKMRLDDGEGKREETILSFIDDPKITNNSSAFEIKNILGSAEFHYAKPSSLIKYLLKISNRKDGIILDFFAGSGTTGQAVLELNKEDKGKRRFILCTNNEVDDETGKNLIRKGIKKGSPEYEKEGICQRVCYHRIGKVMNGYIRNSEKIEGLGGNLKYFRTDFVNAEPTDKNKVKLTRKATEILCLREETYEKVMEKEAFKIYRSNDKYTGIIFDNKAIEEFKEEVKKLNGRFSVYVFSLGGDTFDDEFEDLRRKVKIIPIPESILNTYKKIFGG